ncbi:hypothetical protein [Xanthomonas phaseoli]|uniref:hypothetical protein n=1 Tax=Xanthomonas phaseoli TaxID=1985254 RepID=UPI001ADCE43C|nr:hypothetical protein [Xanthomonas phaseoli]MBO9939997.1 hypothetical protein [Xanthomonas phaseoli pv. dieffenbachiae]
MTTLSRKRAMQRPAVPRRPVADGTLGAGSYACTVTNWTVVKITDVLRSVRPATFRCGVHRRGAADAWCHWLLRPCMRATQLFQAGLRRIVAPTQGRCGIPSPRAGRRTMVSLRDVITSAAHAQTKTPANILAGVFLIYR